MHVGQELRLRTNSAIHFVERLMRQPDYPSDDAPRWASVDDLFAQLLAPSDAVLAAVLENNARAGLPAHDVSAVQGKFLALVVKLVKAARVLEIGTLGGYSTIWMARALPENGKVVTIEKSPDCARVAQHNFRLAQVSDKVELRVGSATEILPLLTPAFDLIFIDADKPNNPTYLEWALRLSRSGTVIIGDNVVRGGAVVDAKSDDASVVGVRRFLTMMASEPRLDSTALQTVGEKGWDGFSISVVRD
jgi:predicted O-methyltransferase YrrM